MSKVLILDGGFYCHKSIFAYIAALKAEVGKICIQLKPDYDKETDHDIFESAKQEVHLLIKNKQLWVSPPAYIYFQMMISDLKKIGVNRNDIIIVALDGRNSWRKAFLLEYKGQRNKLREKQKNIIDWTVEYNNIYEMNVRLNQFTNWNFIEFNLIFDFNDICSSKEGQQFNVKKHSELLINSKFSIEADDTQAYAVRYFKDKEVILVTIDEDLDQLYYFNNCKIFDPNTKSLTNKSKKGYYNIVENPLEIISKKVKKGDNSDNILVNKKTDTPYDMEIRQLIIYLLKLPEFIEKEIKDVLDNLDYNKKTNYSELPFRNSLGKRFDTIYEKKDVRTFEQSIKQHDLKQQKILEKKEIEKEKQKQKRIEKKELSLR